MSLICSSCRITTPDDMSRCPSCGRILSSTELVYSPQRTGYDRALSTTVYDAGEFGAASRVSVPDGVAALMNEICGVGQALLRLANNMSHSPGHTPSTRECIRGCRDLASRLQEEFETRRGP